MDAIAGARALERGRAGHDAPRAEARRERAWELLEALGEGERARRLARAALGEGAAQDAAVLLLELVESRQGALDRERGGVARVDADDGGRADGARGLGAEAALEELQHRFVARRIALGHEGLAREAQLGHGAEQVGLEERGRARRQRAQGAADVDEAAPRRFVRPDDARLDAGRGEQRRRVGAARQDGLRPRLEEKAVAALAADEAARARLGVEQRDVVARGDEPLGGREARDSTPDDRDAHRT